MSHPAEYSLKTLWFSVQDAQGRSRAGVLVLVKWLGEWPLGEALVSQLVEDDRELHALRARIRHPGRLSQSALARFALSELKRRGGPACSEMSFSMAHSSQGSAHWAVVLGFEDESCGVDLEVGAKRARPQAVSERYLSDAERALLQASGLSPWALWCAKEALSKALGTGLKAPLSQYAASGIEQGVVEFAQFHDFVAVAWDLGDLHLSICIPARPEGEQQRERQKNQLRRVPIRGIVPWISDK